jgi:hypothetical protein
MVPVAPEAGGRTCEDALKVRICDNPGRGRRWRYGTSLPGGHASWWMNPPHEIPPQSRNREYGRCRKILKRKTTVKGGCQVMPGVRCLEFAVWSLPSGVAAWGAPTEPGDSSLWAEACCSPSSTKAVPAALHTPPPGLLEGPDGTVPSFLMFATPVPPAGRPEETPLPEFVPNEDTFHTRVK